MSMDSKSYLQSLSGEQGTAAKKTDEPVMIIAGAGSGKTRTLIGRFIHLVTPVDQGGLGADPGSVMMVTFTNKAAREMRERIAPVLEELKQNGGSRVSSEPWIGTFHGLSLRILRVEAKKAGLGMNFSIFDEADARALANEVADGLEMESFDVDQFFTDLDVAKARLLTHDLLAGKTLEIEMAKAMGEELTRTQSTWQRLLREFKTPKFTQVYSAYQRALQEQNAVDFSDLMNRVTKLFQDNEDVRNSWRSTFRHFMVDEVQDINRAQVAWLDMLTDGARPMAVPEGAEDNDWASADHGNHMVNTYRIKRFPRPTVAFVGDDDQAIYSFRGSDVGVMRALEKRYPGLGITFLNQTYRCQQSIVSVASTLVEHNGGRYGKELEPANPNRAKSKVLIEEHVSPEDEIRRIVAEARVHLADGGDPKEFAVLVRTRDLVKAVAKELRAAGLPVTEGKASDIRKSAEVRDAMAFAGYLMNPEAETLLRRIINKPSRGLGPTSIARVNANARLKGVTFIEELRTIMRNRIEVPDGGEGYKDAFIKSATQFGTLIVNMRDAVKTAANAGEALVGILESSGYLPDLKKSALKSAGLDGTGFTHLPPREFLTALISANSDGKEDAAGLDCDAMAERAGAMSETARRIGNLAILIEQAAVFEKLEEFMQDATLEMDQQTTQAGIQVMTVHASKGLEFDRVRLPFWIEGVFPHGRAVEEGDDAIEEERRLAYVAITRAKEDVRISRSWKLHGCPFMRQRDSYPSRFIREIQKSPRDDFQLTSVKGRENILYRSPRLMPLPGHGSAPAPAPAPVHSAVPAARQAAAARPAEPRRSQANSLAGLVGGFAAPRPAKPAAPAPANAPAPARQESRDSAADRPFAPPPDDILDMIPVGYEGMEDDRMMDWEPSRGPDLDSDPEYDRIEL